MERPFDNRIAILKESSLFSSLNGAIDDLYKENICADAAVMLIHECGKLREELKHEYIWKDIDTESPISDNVSDASHTSESIKADISMDTISGSSVDDDSDYEHLHDDDLLQCLKDLHMN